MVAQTIGRVRLSDVTRSQLTIAALGLSVGLVLSDSSIVILELPGAGLGSERTAAAVWAAAGGLGAAAGPAIGGILTDTISWKAIFVAQVPLALAALALVPHRAQAADRGGEPAGRPAPAANLA